MQQAAASRIRKSGPLLARRVTALAALTGFLFVTLLAVSPALHEAFHGHEASSPSHDCLATLLAKGNVLAAAPVFNVPLPAFQICGSATAPQPLLQVGDRRLAPGRAPPG